jgi:RHS repeat-associated protein
VTTLSGGNSASTPGYIVPAQNSTGRDAFVDPATTTATSCQQANLTGTTTFTDALGRLWATEDPLGTGVGPSGSGCLLPGAASHHTTCDTYTAVVASSTAGLPAGDPEPYLQALSIDPNLHQQASYIDALGRTTYAQRYSGASQSPLGNGIASYAVSSYLYDPAGRLRQVEDPASNLTTFTYDELGRLTSSTDPDLGTWTYAYDANGNVTQQTDGRQSAAGTVYAAYDGLDRQLWLGPNSNGTTPYAGYIYDNTGSAPCNGANLVGRLCQETFASGPSQSVTGTYTNAYDQRGRTTSTSFGLTGPSTPQATYTLSATYDDVDRASTATYPAIGGTAETLTYGYNNSAGGVASALTSSITSPTATLFSNPAFTTQGLLAGWQTGVVRGLGTAIPISLSYDGDLRPSDIKFGLQSFIASESHATYDATGNITALTTTLMQPGTYTSASETQVFAYDEQNRMTFGGTQGNTYCTMTGGSEGITGAGYTACYQYDNLGRITIGGVTNSAQSPLANTAAGTYTYDPAHVHELVKVTGSGADYSAVYDSTGDMTCRSVGSSTACSARAQTGQILGYDGLRRLLSWQNAATSPSATEAYAYDGSGQRVWQQATQTSGGTTTTTTITYVLGVEEVTTTAVTGQSPTTSTTSYYPLPTGVTASRDSSGLVYQATDLLGTPNLAFNVGSATVVGAQLRAPYGQARYAAASGSTGGMHTTFGFTSQREDTQAPGSSGLDYFNARYYDPAVGRFTSADDVHPALGDPLGLDNFGYVGGQVETFIDPTGHWLELFFWQKVVLWLSRAASALNPETPTTVIDVTQIPRAVPTEYVSNMPAAATPSVVSVPEGPTIGQSQVAFNSAQVPDNPVVAATERAIGNVSQTFGASTNPVDSGDGKPDPADPPEDVTTPSSAQSSASGSPGKPQDSTQTPNQMSKAGARVKEINEANEGEWQSPELSPEGEKLQVREEWDKYERPNGPPKLTPKAKDPNDPEDPFLPDPSGDTSPAGNSSGTGPGNVINTGAGGTEGGPGLSGGGTLEM